MKVQRAEKLSLDKADPLWYYNVAPERVPDIAE